MAPAGYYNRHSSLQAAALDSGLDWLAVAAAEVPLPDPGPITVADFGVAQGANSMQPMARALDALRARTDAPIQVVHTDLPGNDFAPLFEIFAGDPSSYLRGRTGVYPYAIGRSLYRELFAPGTVQLGWSSTTTHWLSHSPVEVVEHVQPASNPPAIRSQFAAVAAQDWVEFLEARAAELAPGGWVVMVEPVSKPGGDTGADGFTDVLDECLGLLVEAGTITSEQRARIVQPAWLRSEDEYTAPVDDVAHLHLRDHDVVRRGTNPLRAQFEQTGDAQAYAEATAGFARGYSEAMFFGDLPNATQAADEFYALVAEVGAAAPERLHIETWDLRLELERTR